MLWWPGTNALGETVYNDPPKSHILVSDRKK